jgi:hypothetical protein
MRASPATSLADRHIAQPPSASLQRLEFPAVQPRVPRSLCLLRIHREHHSTADVFLRQTAEDPIRLVTQPQLGLKVVLRLSPDCDGQYIY